MTRKEQLLEMRQELFKLLAAISHEIVEEDRIAWKNKQDILRLFPEEQSNAPY